MAQPMRGFRCPDEVWGAARDKAALEHRPLAGVLVAALVRYAHTPLHNPDMFEHGLDLSGLDLPWLERKEG
jgi:hypothetical protein